MLPMADVELPSGLSLKNSSPAKSLEKSNFFYGVCVCVCVFACVHVCLCVDMCMCLFICARVRVYLYVRMSLFEFVCVCTRLCMCVACVSMCSVYFIEFYAFSNAFTNNNNCVINDVIIFECYSGITKSLYKNNNFSYSFVR